MAYIELSLSWNISQISIEKTMFVSQPEGTQSASINILKSACDWTGLSDLFIFYKEKAAFIVCQTWQLLQTVSNQIAVGIVQTQCTCLDMWCWIFSKCVSFLPWLAVKWFHIRSCKHVNDCIIRLLQVNWRPVICVGEGQHRYQKAMVFCILFSI